MLRIRTALSYHTIYDHTLQELEERCKPRTRRLLRVRVAAVIKNRLWIKIEQLLTMDNGWPRPFSHMRGAWGLGTSLVLGSFFALFSCLRRGRGGGASESSFLILKQPAVATKLGMFKSEIFKLEMFGLEMVG